MKYYYDLWNSQYSEDYVPIEKPIYALAYDINDDTEQRRLTCRPTKGKIIENEHYKLWARYVFVPFKKGTEELRKSGEVNYLSRMYADTYEEAVEMYNELVQKRIDNLREMILKAEEDKIKGMENETYEDLY